MSDSNHASDASTTSSCQYVQGYSTTTSTSPLSCAAVFIPSFTSSLLFFPLSITFSLLCLCCLLLIILEKRHEKPMLEFSEDEADLIARMFRLVGKRWSLIAGRIPGRTAEEIEKYWTSKCAFPSDQCSSSG